MSRPRVIDPNSKPGNMNDVQRHLSKKKIPYIGPDRDTLGNWVITIPGSGSQNQIRFTSAVRK